MTTGPRLSNASRARMQARARFLEDNKDRLAIDGDVHPTPPALVPADMAARMDADPNYFHGHPLLSGTFLENLDLAGLDMALCWQNPSTVIYTDDLETNTDALRNSNEAIAALADAYPERVIPAGWTDPKALGVANAIAIARHCVETLAMPVVKMNPAQNAYPIDDPMVLETLDEIVAMGAIPAFHFGADTEFTPTEGLVSVAARHPDHPVIAVHMGGGGAHFVVAEETYQTARAAGLENPNIFYILSAKRDVHMVSDLITYAAAGDPSCRNIALGSDAPYGDMLFQFSGFRALFDAFAGASYPEQRLAQNPALFDPATVQGFMGRNMAELVANAYGRIVERAAA
ncbi:putative TIM-barrel fold metal-dependent hydrolase [Aliiruegeria haliotis]|uniref:Putative TIM-barrel fold metal-dependent hydrolase n=1 Tax=Aliiruegeria haliotis TaxID=1280846 RepID=A0A2T0RM29_9RHOB|nr:amidohydrolase family protein [Aliiruegeria haliotis]PRY22245.1 putative TIM-barrel fold metal-dependent hydrolase [Aliiruegeria haliotis]